MLQSVPDLKPQPGIEVAQAVKAAAVGAASSVPVPLSNMAALTQPGGGKGAKGKEVAAAAGTVKGGKRGNSAEPVGKKGVELESITGYSPDQGEHLARGQHCSVAVAVSKISDAS